LEREKGGRTGHEVTSRGDQSTGPAPLAANAAGIRDAAAQTASFAATAPADKAAPVTTSVQMFDTVTRVKTNTADAILPPPTPSRNLSGRTRAGD